MNIDIDTGLEKIFLKEIFLEGKQPHDVLRNLILEYIEDPMSARLAEKAYNQHLEMSEKGVA